MSDFSAELSRRDFMRLMGASMALAGLGGCAKQPLEEIFPYVRPPEEIVPGKPLFFASALTLGGIATGVLVESHMGRPTKIEGNPEHPSSLGATDAFAQAAILGLYDPDRSQTITHLGSISTWSKFLDAMRAEMERQQGMRGAGLRILTEATTSPTLVAQIGRLLADLPLARWHRHEPVGDDASRAGALLAFGEPVQPLYRIAKADVILSLGADFLGCGPGAVRAAREFAARRRPRRAPTR